MSMMEPVIPVTRDEQDTIPAADPGAGAPEPSPGFGVSGEEPDTTDAEPGGDLEEEVQRRATQDVPFRTPEPGGRS